MGLVYIYTRVEIYMPENGQMIYLMEKELIYSVVVKDSKVNLRKVGKMVLECILT